MSEANKPHIPFPLTPHPDAGLLSLIDLYAEIEDRRHREWDKANRYPHNSIQQNKIIKVLRETSQEREELERTVCRTKAATPLGAIAKLQVALGHLSPNGEDGLGQKGHVNFMYATAISAVRDAISVLEAVQ